MRCADRGPTPGSTRSASTRRSRPFAVGTASVGFNFKTPGSSKRQFEARRQAKVRRHAAHFFRDGALDPVRGIVECRSKKIFEHLSIVPDKRRIDAHAL